LLTLHDFKRKPSLRQASLLALSYAGLLMTHNISALIFTPFALLYAFLPLSPAPFHMALLSLLPLLWGLGLSAWFWAPALLEGRYVQLEDVTTGYFHYGNHFRGANLVQRSLAFDYSIRPGHMPFAMGLAQAVLVALGVSFLISTWVRKRRIEIAEGFFALSFFLSTWLITPLSRPMWDHLPLLPFVQFPWRFLSLQAFFGAVLTGALAEGPISLRLDRARPALALTLGLLMMANSLIGLRPERLHIGEGDITTERLMLYEHFTANIGTTIRHEYLPCWVVPRPFTSEWVVFGKEPLPRALEGELAGVESLLRRPTERAWRIRVASPEALLSFPLYYFPGWRAEVDGKKAAAKPLDGLGTVSLRLNQGEHVVRLWLGHTPLRLASELISLASLALALVLALLGKARVIRGRTLLCATGDFKEHPTSQNRDVPRRARRWAGWTALALLTLFLLARLDASLTGPSPSPSDLSMDFLRAPYLHHNPEGIRFGKEARLRRYEFSQEELRRGEELEVVLHWEVMSEVSLTAQVSLTDAGGELFDREPLAISRAVVEGESSRHLLKVPPGALPGPHFITVRLYKGEEEIRPCDERGETLGTVHLRPIRIVADEPVPCQGPILALFGERIALCRATAKQTEPTALRVEILWQAMGPVPANYLLALRLRSPDNEVVASLDTRPCHGLYPTGLWRPGESIPDLHVLRLPEGTPPGEDYRLEVVLYSARDLTPVGSTMVEPVVLRLPTVKERCPTLARLGDLALVEAKPQRESLHQGETMDVRLAWWAPHTPSLDYSVTLTLEGEEGSHLRARFPVASGYPTSHWPSGAFVVGRYRLRLPPHIPPGHYALRIKLTDPRGQEVSEHLVPRFVEVQETPRNFVIPSMGKELGVDFGGQIRLLGYDLERRGGEILLRLHWQALGYPEDDYKVFVHLFDPTNEVIVAQHDAMPRGGAYPTSRWVPGEVVSEEVRLSLDGVSPGRYRLGVGLYHPVTGARLHAVSSAGTPIPADRVVLEEEVVP